MKYFGISARVLYLCNHAKRYRHRKKNKHRAINDFIKFKKMIKRI